VEVEDKLKKLKKFILKKDCYACGGHKIYSYRYETGESHQCYVEDIGIHERSPKAYLVDIFCSRCGIQYTIL